MDVIVNQLTLDGVRHVPGSIIDLPEQLAAELIANGRVRAVPAAPEAPPAPAPEPQADAPDSPYPPGWLGRQKRPDWAPSTALPIPEPAPPAEDEDEDAEDAEAAEDAAPVAPRRRRERRR